jgi:hypothetical protein
MGRGRGDQATPGTLFTSGELRVYVNAQTNLSSYTQNAARQIYGLLRADLGNGEIQFGSSGVKIGWRRGSWVRTNRK